MVFTVILLFTNMGKSKFEIRRDKKITNSYCKKYSILEIANVLRKDNKSLLWDKFKTRWTIEDWKDFLKLKINNDENNKSS